MFGKTNVHRGHKLVDLSDLGADVGVDPLLGGELVHGLSQLPAKQHGQLPQLLTELDQLPQCDLHLQGVEEAFLNLPGIDPSLPSRGGGERGVLSLQPGVGEHQAVHLGAGVGGRLGHRAGEETIGFQQDWRREAEGGGALLVGVESPAMGEKSS